MPNAKTPKNQPEVDQWNETFPPVADTDMRTRVLYDDPSADITDQMKRLAVETRAMPAVRAIIKQYNTDLMSLLSAHRPCDPSIRRTVTSGLDLVRRAEAEVVRAERGCGQPEGECTDPCHAGVVDDGEPGEPALSGTSPTNTALVTSIVVACDGSSLSNPGPAGWSWYVSDDCWAAGGETVATNNAMELTAVLRFLETVADLPDVPTLIRCDSTYVIDGLTKWWRDWERRGWKNAAGQPVKNPELFKANLSLLAQRTNTRFEWVKGHASDPLNEAADECAYGAAKLAQNGNVIDLIGPGWTD